MKVNKDSITNAILGDPFLKTALIVFPACGLPPWDDIPLPRPCPSPGPAWHWCPDEASRSPPGTCCAPSGRPW